MKNGILVRGMLALAAALTLSTVGVITFASEAGAATPAITVTPNSGLQSTGSTVVTVTGSGFTPSTLGSMTQCSNDKSQPTVDVTLPVVGVESIPVSCSGFTASTVVTTDASGNLPSGTTFTVNTGTIGPPCGGTTLGTCAATDSSGGNPATDAAKYPCPPTSAQLAAGDSCTVAYAQSATATSDRQHLLRRTLRCSGGRDRL